MKPWYKSKTIQFNLAILVAILTATEVLAVVPKDWLPYVMALVAAVNVYLRAITKEGVRR